MKRIFIVLVIILLIALPAYAVYNNFVRNSIGDKVDIRGVITNIIVNNEGEGTILVEGQIEEDTTQDYASIRIDKNTIINRGVTSKKLQLSDLKVGDRVEVKFIGPVAESYPVQAKAQYITVLE
jgi:beta-N-acetylhexosaminidase